MRTGAGPGKKPATFPMNQVTQLINSADVLFGAVIALSCLVLGLVLGRKWMGKIDDSSDRYWGMTDEDIAQQKYWDSPEGREHSRQNTHRLARGVKTRGRY